eukprot:g4400.t1
MSGARALRNAEGNRTSLLASKDKNDKKRGSLKKRPTHKFMKFLERSEGIGSKYNFRDDGDLANQLASSSAVFAESGRMQGKQQQQMAVFEQEDFDLEKFSELQLTNLTEKGIGTLKNGLASLQDHSEEEAQQVILGSYSAFVDACEGVAQVDSKFEQLRVLITGTTSLANELKRAVQPGSGRLINESSELITLSPSIDLTNKPTNRLGSVLEELDVSIAERDFPVASKLLIEADKELEVIHKREYVSADLEIDERRQRIVILVENQLQDPTLGAQDRHYLLQTLSSVAGDVHAVESLLNLHSLQIAQSLQMQVKPHRSGVSEHEGADYAGSLAQCTFHGIGLAVEDFRSIFNSSNSSQLCPLLTQWAEKEARKCAEMIDRNSLSAFGAVGGLSAIVDTISISLVFAQALNNTHSIYLMPFLRKELWSTLEGMIQKFFVTTADEICVSVHDEMSVFWKSSSPWDRQSTASETGPPLESAQLLIERLRYLCGVLRPLWCGLARAPMKSGIKLLINSLVEALANDVKEKSSDEMDTNILDQMCEWLMNTIATLVEDLVPKELTQLERKIGVIFTKNELDCFVNNAATALGLEQIKEGF